MIAVPDQFQPYKRSQYPDLTNSSLLSLDNFERESQDIGRDSPEIYALVRGLQRQLNIQRTKLDLANSKIGETEMQLRQVSADLMTAQEVERRRIALDLHDSIGQSLSAIGFGIGSALETNRCQDHAASAEILMMLGQQVNATVEEVRRIAHNLRPAILDDLGIVGTLTWFLREFGGLHPDMSLFTTISAQELEVPITLRTPIYRIVQEGLNNVVRHSGATEISITLTAIEQSILLEIADNGCGFIHDLEGQNFDPSSAGLGLKGMRDRVEFSGGEFDLQTSPGQGTWIRCHWDRLPEIGDLD